MDFVLHPPHPVSEVAQRLHEVLTGDSGLADITMQGEISNYTRATSGHLYFSIKDPGACIRCVMWRRQAAQLPRFPREGEAIYAFGSFDLYPARGDVQFYVEELEYIGAGLLFQQFQALKERLDREGLFAPERKRSLPRFPRRIGLVTSREGAVLHDMLHILERRYPLPEIFLVPATVQGDGAPPQIVAALARLQRVQDLDLIILARGGGSFEDLFCFNDERVARAIVASRVPVISGVGHETDFTIADFCADVRAPTPTAAAQFCTPDQNELRADILLAGRRLGQAARGVFEEGHRRLRADLVALDRVSPQRQIAARRQQVDELSHAAAAHLRRRVALQREQLRGARRHLEALNPNATLGRGYAIVRKKPAGQVVTRQSQVGHGDMVEVRVTDGEFDARVE